MPTAFRTISEARGVAFPRNMLEQPTDSVRCLSEGKKVVYFGNGFIEKRSLEKCRGWTETTLIECPAAARMVNGKSCADRETGPGTAPGHYAACPVPMGGELPGGHGLHIHRLFHA
jgi:hypothetical protein